MAFVGFTPPETLTGEPGEKNEHVEILVFLTVGT